MQLGLQPAALRGQRLLGQAQARLHRPLLGDVLDGAAHDGDRPVGVGDRFGGDPQAHSGHPARAAELDAELLAVDQHAAHGVLHGEPVALVDGVGQLLDRQRAVRRVAVEHPVQVG